METCSSVAKSFRTIAELLETFSSDWLFISVKFKDKITNLILALGYSEVNTRIGSVGVIVET